MLVSSHRVMLLMLLATVSAADYATLENWSEFCSLEYDCETDGVTCYGDVKLPVSCEQACDELADCRGYEVLDSFCLLYSDVPIVDEEQSKEMPCHHDRLSFAKGHSGYSEVADWNELCARGDSCESDGLTCSEVASDTECRQSCDESTQCGGWSYFNDFCVTASYLPERVNADAFDCHSGVVWFTKNTFIDPSAYTPHTDTDAFCDINYNCDLPGVKCFSDVQSIYVCSSFALELNAGGYQIGALDGAEICVIFIERPSDESNEKCQQGVTYIKGEEPDEYYDELKGWSEYCARGDSVCGNGGSCTEQSHEPECRHQCMADSSCQGWEYMSHLHLCVTYSYIPVDMMSEDSCHIDAVTHITKDPNYEDDMFVHTPEYSAFCMVSFDCEEGGVLCIDVNSAYDCRELAGGKSAQGYEISGGICVLFEYRPRLDPDTTPSVCTTPDQETYINYRPTEPPAVPEPTAAPCDCKVISTCLFVNSNEADLVKKKAKLASALDRASDIHKQCCVSFSLHTGRVQEFNYSTVPVGKGGKTLGDILLPDGTIPAKEVGDETILVNPTTGARVGELDFSDVLYAMQSLGQQLCPDVVTPKEDACKRLRIFAFQEFANTTKLGLGLKRGRTMIIEFNQHTLGTTLAHEAGHNLGLEHTEDSPASAENADPDNLMHESSSSSGNPARLSTYLSRATLSERQCTAERGLIERLGLCHTTLERQQCPNTTWDGIREDLRRVDEEHQRNLTAINTTVAERRQQLNRNITSGRSKLREVDQELKDAGAPNHQEYNRTKQQKERLEAELLAHEKKIRATANNFSDEYVKNGAKINKVPIDLKKSMHFLYPCIRDGILKKLRKLKKKPYGKIHRFPYKHASPEHDDVIKKCIEKYAKKHNTPVEKASPQRKLTAGYREIQEKIKAKQAKIDKYDKVMSGPTGDKYREAKEQINKAKEDIKKLPEFKEDLKQEQTDKRRAALDRLVKDFERRTSAVNSHTDDVLSTLRQSL